MCTVFWIASLFDFASTISCPHLTTWVVFVYLESLPSPHFSSCSYKGNTRKSPILLLLKFMLINPHCTNGAGYEWDVGHFEGSARPEVECFKSTEFGLSDTMVWGICLPSPNILLVELFLTRPLVDSPCDA